MDTEELARLIRSLQTMAVSNQELVQQLIAGGMESKPAVEATGQTNTDPTADAMGAVALTNVQVPMKMGSNAEERLVNFLEWCTEVEDKFSVVNIKDEKRKTSIALMFVVTKLYLLLFLKVKLNPTMIRLCIFYV